MNEFWKSERERNNHEEPSPMKSFLIDSEFRPRFGRDRDTELFGKGFRPRFLKLSISEKEKQFVKEYKRALELHLADITAFIKEMEVDK